MNQFAVSCGFGHVCWRSPSWKTSFFDHWKWNQLVDRFLWNKNIGFKLINLAFYLNLLLVILFPSHSVLWKTLRCHLSLTFGLVILFINFYWCHCTLNCFYADINLLAGTTWFHILKEEFSINYISVGRSVVLALDDKSTYICCQSFRKIYRKKFLIWNIFNVSFTPLPNCSLLLSDPPCY